MSNKIKNSKKKSNSAIADNVDTKKKDISFGVSFYGIAGFKCISV